jgi:hypothetical protein
MHRRTLVLILLILNVGHGLQASQLEPNPEAEVDRRPPVGLDLEFVEGTHAPLQVIADGTFFVDSMTLRTSVEGTGRNIVERLRTQSAFRYLDWKGLEVERYEWLPNPDGSLKLEQLYQGARWMGGEQRFSLAVRDAQGGLLAGPLEIESTPLWPAPASEAFATRRFSALVLGHEITDPSESDDAEHTAEAWVQLRNGVPEGRTFVIPLDADRLEITWNRMPDHVFEVPLEPVIDSAWGYGFRIQVDPSPPGNGVSYHPGETIVFQVTFADGDGRPLHSPSSLPTYEEFVTGQVASGLQYYNFFPAIVYYRNKNREGVLLASFTGPAHRVSQTHEAVPLAAFLEGEVQVAAVRAEHGYSSQWRMIPPAPVVFGGGAAWMTPVSPALTFQLPQDALAGTYEFVIKARRVFRGEESLTTTVVPVLVGDPEIPTDPAETPLVGNCDSCHAGIFDLARMLHYNGEVQTCTPCHLPLEFETNNLLPYRIHRIHYLSERYTEPRDKCAPCHLNPTPEVLDDARWLVCTGCHDPWETHRHTNYAGDLKTCGDYHCHHTNNPEIHDMSRD